MSEGKRVKRWAPKVFSGCQTCKRRRIKCDETKPTCQRCARSGLQCEGYQPPQTRIFDPKKQEQAQDKQQALALRTPTSSSSSSSLASSTSRAPTFASAEETRSFEFFIRKTSDLISVYSQPHFWSVIIPQASSKHDGVKHSVLALSVLHESLSMVGKLTADYNKRLIHHYNTAIRAITRSQPTTDVVLMTCILFWTIESFNGSKKPSFNHLEAAVKILNEFKSKEDHESSPHYEVITKYIEPTIKDGMRHASTQRVIDVTDAPEDSPDRTDKLRERLPTALTSIEAATQFLRICLEATLEIFGKESSEKTKQMVESLEDHLHRWVAMFRELAPVGSACDRRVLVVHHVNNLALLAELRKQYGMEEQNPDKFRSQYYWNVNEIEDLMSSKPKLDSAIQNPLTVVHHLGFAPPLFAAAVRCSDTTVQAKAVKILRSWGGQEGDWTGTIAVRIAQTICQLRDKDQIGLQLDCIGFEKTEYGLRLYEKASDPRFDFFLGGSKQDAESIDTESLEKIVRCYGYQFQPQS